MKLKMAADQVLKRFSRQIRKEDASKEQEWINSLKNRKLTVRGLMSFYAQAPAMRILEKDQVTFARRICKNCTLVRREDRQKVKKEVKVSNRHACPEVHSQLTADNKLPF
jgi:hypothetical protein